MVAKKTDLDPFVYGKVPPSNVQAEEAILGALLLEKDALDRVSHLLKPETFYSEQHQRIYRAIQNLSGKSHPVEIITVIEELKRAEELDLVGGAYYLTRLTNSVVSGANIEFHAKIIFEKFLLREQIKVCGKGLTAAYEDNADAFDTLDALQEDLSKLTVNNLTVEVEHIAGTLVDRFKRIEQMRHREDHLTGVTTGFKELNYLTAGWQDTDLIIVAARPSVGKTAFALNLMTNAAHAGVPVGFFSLEMSKGQLVDRVMSAETGIPLENIVRAKMNDEQMQDLYVNGLQKLAGIPIFIDDAAAMNIYELRAKARRLRSKQKIGLIIIDYLQLMSGIGDRKSNREQEISNISRSLKALAKELHVPIIALSQLSREIEKQKREPQLSDLRESGAIEQDADMVIFLTRPDYQETDMTGEAVKDFADIHIKKNRNGDLAKIPMKTMLYIQRWMTGDQYDMFQRNMNFSRLKRVNLKEENPF